jgi:hypothetical protein
LLLPPGVVHFEPHFGAVALAERTHEYVVQVQGAPRLHGHGLVNAHAGRGVVPAEQRVVVAGAGGGVYLVAVELTAVVAHVAAHRVVVLHLDEQGVVAPFDQSGHVKFKRGEDALVRTRVVAVDEHLGLVIHAFAVDENGAQAEHPFTHRESGAVVRNGLSQRRAVVRQLHLLPGAFPGEEGRKIPAVLLGFLTPAKGGQFLYEPFRGEAGGQVLQVRLVFFPHC